MADPDALKQAVIAAIDRRQRDLIALSLQLHANPETAFQEEKAARWLSDLLEAEGFALERGICQMPTAFRAIYGSGRPHIAFLAEYDALPGIGHGCGHNIIATASLAAGLAAKEVIAQTGGTVLVIGTPAEEGAGGKVYMAARGAFEGLDCAMLVHPENRDAALCYTRTLIQLDVEFFGKAAHAAARPEAGVNALDAMIIAFSSLGLLRQQLRDSVRIHGIITDGGQAVNVIPHHTAASLFLRSDDDPYLEELREKVLACFQAAAQASGCRLEHRWGEQSRYMAMRNNFALAQAFKANLEALGRRVVDPGYPNPTFSTDMGNVSHIVPAIHPTIAIAPPDIPIHSEGFRDIAASEAGHQGLLDAAKAMALTAADLFTEPHILQRAWAEFKGGG